MQRQHVDNLLLESLVTTTSLKSLVQGYILNYRTEGKSPKTISIAEMILGKFIWYCDQNNFPDVNQLSVIHIRQFLSYLANTKHRWNSTSPIARRPVSKTTVNVYFRTLRPFFNWLQREDIIKDNPFIYLKTPKTDKKVIQALTPIEVERLFKVCSGRSPLDIRNKAILSIFLDTGLRISELAGLTLDDIDMDQGSLLIRNGKGGKQRIVHIGTKAHKILWKYITIHRRSYSRRLFTNRNNEPLEVIGIKILVKRLGDKAKVKVHPHKLRHTFAISYLRAGGDVFSLQYILGHSTLQMTQRYLQSLNAEDAINAHKKFSPLDNLKKW